MSNVSTVSTIEVAPGGQRFIYLSMGMVGVVINVAAVLVVSTKQLISAKVARTLFFHQCTVDALSCVCSMTMWTAGTERAMPEGLLGDVVCRLWSKGFILWLIIQVSVNNQVLFTVERYLSVVRPLLHRRLTLRRLALAFLLSWLLSCATNVGMAFEGRREGSACTSGHIPAAAYAVYGTVNFLTCFLIPLVALVLLQSRMFVYLKQQETRLRLNPFNYGRVAMRRDLAITVGIAGVTYLCFFGTDAIVYYLRTLSLLRYDDGDWLDDLNTFLVNLNFLLNPSIYLLRMRPVRRQLARLCRPCRHPDPRPPTCLPSPPLS